MLEEIDQEIAAIKVVLDALTPLTAEVRQSVLRYVTGRLKIDQACNREGEQTPREPMAGSVSRDAVKPGIPPVNTPIHIKAFKEQKNPRSVAEMSAIVAYYLGNLAPQAERKDRITTKEIDTYFKIADFPLPRKIEMTLVNAKASGYFDSVGNGEYRLNAVGHNLVAHNLPRGAETPASAPRTPSKRSRRPAKKR